jgi:hypothetical protein
MDEGTKQYWKSRDAWKWSEIVWLLCEGCPADKEKMRDIIRNGLGHVKNEREREHVVDEVMLSQSLHADAALREAVAMGALLVVKVKDDDHETKYLFTPSAVIK